MESRCHCGWEQRRSSRRSWRKAQQAVRGDVSNQQARRPRGPIDGRKDEWRWGRDTARWVVDRRQRRVASRVGGWSVCVVSGGKWQTKNGPRQARSAAWGRVSAGQEAKGSQDGGRQRVEVGRQPRGWQPFWATGLVPARALHTGVPEPRGVQSPKPVGEGTL